MLHTRDDSASSYNEADQAETRRSCWDIQHLMLSPWESKNFDGYRGEVKLECRLPSKAEAGVIDRQGTRGLQNLAEAAARIAALSFHAEGHTLINSTWQDTVISHGEITARFTLTFLAD
ncbi:MAG: hypothetical protein AAGF15_01310 [Pseudomonadota bacterium]